MVTSLLLDNDLRATSAVSASAEDSQVSVFCADMEKGRLLTVTTLTINYVIIKYVMPKWMEMGLMTHN